MLKGRFERAGLELFVEALTIQGVLEVWPIDSNPLAVDVNLLLVHAEVGCPLLL